MWQGATLAEEWRIAKKGDQEQHIPYPQGTPEEPSHLPFPKGEAGGDFKTQITRWHFEPGTFHPLAKEEIKENEEGAATNFYPIVTDHMGTPKELFDTEGNCVWHADHDLWGEAKSVWRQKKEIPEQYRFVPLVDCHLRFQNQWLDEETGLHYNLNRYYDPDSGQYLTTDPIGLEGGLRTHAYVHNPMQWVDPLGLCKAGGKNFKEGKTFYRSMSRAEAEAVKKTGKLRGGNPGETFFTDSHYKSAVRAQDRLSLPQRPEVQMEFKINNNPTPIRDGITVKPDYGGSGGGREYMTTDPVEVEIVNIQPY